MSPSKKGLLIAIGDGHHSSPDGDEESDDMGADSAGAEVWEAVKSDDKDAFVAALKAFVAACNEEY